MIEAAREAYKRVSVIPSRFGIVWSVCLASGVRALLLCILLCGREGATLIGHHGGLDRDVLVGHPLADLGAGGIFAAGA